MVEPIWRSAKTKVNILWSEEFPFQVAQDFSKLSFVKDEHIKKIHQTQEGKCHHEMKTIHNILHSQ